MCFILCCCCNLCNNYSSKCIEISILILSIASLGSSLIGLLLINKEHASKIGYACLLIVISFSIILIISITLILIWRYRSVVNTTRNFAASAFSKIGLVTTIFCLLFVGIWESMSISYFYDLNYPCTSIKRTETIKGYDRTNVILLLRRNRRRLITFEENKEEFCSENPEYRIDEVSNMEYLFLLLSASAIEVILLVLLYFWYNDFRRIKYLVDGKLIDSNTKENKIKYVDKRNNFSNNFHLNMGYKDYVVHYDIYGRPIFNNVKKTKTFSSKNVNQLDIHKKRANVIDREKFRNKNIVEVDKIVSFENSGNNYTSDRINIYSKSLSKKNNNSSNFGLSLNKSLNKNLEITVDNNK
jgi:hypothetical protein